MNDRAARELALHSALEQFFSHYYKRRPVNATFTGVHEYDAALPDWSESGLVTLEAEMHMLSSQLHRLLTLEKSLHPDPEAHARRLRDEPVLLDAALAHDFLAIQITEHASRHGPRGNPALWSGEAVFSVVSLMIRDSSPIADRAAAAIARMTAIPRFLHDAEVVLARTPFPDAWREKALRDCAGADRLFDEGVKAWARELVDDAPLRKALLHAATAALIAFANFGAWLRARPVCADGMISCGTAKYDLLLLRGHHCLRSRSELLAEARGAFAAEKSKLAALAAAVAGSWENAQAQMADDHPTADNYLNAFQETWGRCRARAVEADVVTWPDWPIRYVPFPAATRDAAPYLYYLFYRAPAPLDPYTVYDYVVPPLPDDPIAHEKHLRAWNQSVITLNHVVHHGAIGHHVQNWHAYHRAPSRIGKIAAVDCANRVGMFCAGTMAEGWACYATELMEELEFLTPLERVSEQHSRMRFLARAIVDIELHQGTMTVDECVAFYRDEVGMSVDVARAETTKNGMFPCTAIMYWLGTQSILDLRRDMQAKLGPAFSLKNFHDTLLGYGSIPVPLIARMMLAEAA